MLPCPPLQAFGDRRGSSARNCMKEMIWGDGSGGKSNRNHQQKRKITRKYRKSLEHRPQGRDVKGPVGQEKVVEW